MGPIVVLSRSDEGTIEVLESIADYPAQLANLSSVSLAEASERTTDTYSGSIVCSIRRLAQTARDLHDGSSMAITG
jgi:hypothetical protein